MEKFTHREGEKFKAELLLFLTATIWAGTFQL
jgi:hypothetical protein